MQNNDIQNPDLQLKEGKYIRYENKPMKQTKVPTQEVIANRKKLYSMNRYQLADYMTAAALHSRKYLKDNDIPIDPKSLVTLYKQGNEYVLKALQDYEDALGHNVTARQAGITYRELQDLKKREFNTEAELIDKKFKFMPSNANLQEFVTQYEIPAISRKKLEELMIIDDWSNIFSSILPAVKKGAFNVIDWAHDKYIKPELEEQAIQEAIEKQARQYDIEKKRVQLDKQKAQQKKRLEQYSLQNEFDNEDWGQVPIDQGADPTTQMWKMARVPGQTYEQVPRSILRSNSQTNVVDIAYIRAFLCPEYYTAKAPLPGYAPCQTIQSSVNYTLTSTDTGSSLVIFNPWNLGQDVASSQTTFQCWYAQNPTSFNTDTGAYTGLIPYDGPLVPIQSDLMNYRILSASLVFVPTLSENNAQGSVAMAQYLNTNTNLQGLLPTAANFPLAQNSSMSANSTYVSGNIRSVYRQATLPTAGTFSGAWYNRGQTFYQNTIVMTVAGAPPNTVIGKVYIYFNAEIRYNPNAQRFTTQQPSLYSPATLELVQHLATHESLFMQNSNDIRKPLLQTFNTDLIHNYDNIANLLITHAQNSKGRSIYEQPVDTQVESKNVSFIE